MVDSLLRLQYAASDPVAATAAMRAVLGSAEVAARAGAFGWEQTSLVDDGITVSSVRSHGEAVRLRLRGASELLLVQVDSGSASLSTGGDRLELGLQDLGLVPIGAHAELRWHAAHLRLFAIPAYPIARLLGVPRTAVRLHAPRLDPCSPDLAEYLRLLGRLLASGVFGAPGVYGRDLVRSSAIDAFTAAVVEAFELTNYSEDVSDRDGAVIRRAIAEMRARLTESITVPEVAESAGVSVRGLQMAFQRQLGVTPVLHLRQLRLEAARSALVDEAVTGTTIADIAKRFGYANSGRFSTHYRNEYGEAPSATLHRVRSAAGPAPSTEGSAPAESELVSVGDRYSGEGAFADGDASGRATPAGDAPEGPAPTR